MHRGFALKFAIAVFVKTPGVSPIKTRLAADIGSDEALKVYLKCLAAVEKKIIAVVENSPYLIEPFWAVAEKNSLSNSCWKSWPQIYQGEGELGNRLDKVYSELLMSHDGVILMGADSPLFPAQEVANGIDWLAQNKLGAAIGPTLDGGYYFFGCRRPIPKTVWTSVPYSRENTLETFSKVLPSDFGKYFLAKHWDIDTLDDLHRLKLEDPSFLDE